MNLAQLQKRMATDLMKPLGRSDRLASHTPASYLKRNDRLTSRERLEIYSRSYWYRLIDSLHEDFPGTRALLGPRAFMRLTKAYLAECPSQSFSMRDLGSRLEPWLLENRTYAGHKFEMLLDMVRLEWAHIEAWDAGSFGSLGLEDFDRTATDLAVSLQPHVRLLELTYPVDELRLKINASSESSRPARPRSLKANPRFLVVHRQNLSVYYKAVSREEFTILQAIRRGRMIVDAIGQGLAGSALKSCEISESVERWLASWASLGWLVRKRGKVPPGRCPVAAVTDA